MSAWRLRLPRVVRRGVAPAACFLVFAGCAVEPAARSEVRTLEGIGLTHRNVVEQVGEENPDIVVTASDDAIADVLAEQGLRLYFCRRDDEQFTKVIMGTAGSPTRFLASIPHQPRGTWIDYYIEVRGKGGELLTFPGTAGAGVYYPLRFEGRAPRIVALLHTGMMWLALFFFLFAAYRGWRFLRVDGPYGGLEGSTFFGLAALFAGGGPLAFLTGYYTLGTPWSGYPVGDDVADTATLILLLYWIVVVGLLRTSRSGGESADEAPDAARRRYARLVVAGGFLTAIVYAVSHGI